MVLVTSITGCGRKKESEKNNINNNHVQNSNENLVEIPSGYPLDLVPIMEGYKLIKAIEVSGRYQITYKVDKGIEDVKNYYANLFPNALKEDNDNETIYKYNFLNDEFAINQISITSISEKETEVFIYLEPID